MGHLKMLHLPLVDTKRGHSANIAIPADCMWRSTEADSAIKCFSEADAYRRRDHDMADTLKARGIG